MIQSLKNNWFCFIFVVNKDLVHDKEIPYDEKGQ